MPIAQSGLQHRLALVLLLAVAAAPSLAAHGSADSSAGDTPIGPARLSAEDSMPQRLQFPHLPPPVGPYAHGVLHGRTLYLSGLTAMGTPAQQAPAGEQARAILAQIGGVLRQQGLDWSALLKVTVFVTEAESLHQVRAALSETYGARPPASSLVRVAGLVDPSLKVEIEAVVGLADAASGEPSPPTR